MASRHPPDPRAGRFVRESSDPSFPQPGNGGDGSTGRFPAGEGWRQGAGPDLRTLISRLGEDVSQLAHDELALAKLELRSVADTLSGDLENAAKTLVKDLAKVGIALSLAILAGLALTAGAIIGIGLLVGAYWAGGLIVGVVYLIAAAVFGMSAARDLQTSDSLRMEATRRRAEQNRDVLAREAEESKRFAREEAQEFKEHASRDRGRTEARH